MAEWTAAVWNMKFALHFYTWQTLGIEPQVECAIQINFWNHTGGKVLNKLETLCTC